MSEHDAPAGAAPPCEVVNKTPEEYAATLAKLGVAKVCNKKHRPTGSDEPFVLCEKTGGLATHSACGACSRTRSGKSHNRTSHGRSESRSRCPCDRLGVPCLHSKGDKKKRYNPKLLCARCRDGKCDYDYHQNDPKAKHFRKPPPATDAAGV